MFIVLAYHRYMQACVPGGAGGAMEISADQLTLSQPRGADYAQQIILVPADFQTFLQPYNINYVPQVPIFLVHLP